MLHSSVELGDHYEMDKLIVVTLNPDANKIERLKETGWDRSRSGPKNSLLPDVPGRKGKIGRLYHWKEGSLRNKEKGEEVFKELKR